MPYSWRSIMPQYDYICTKCEDRRTITLKISEYDEQTLKDKSCGKEGCDGVYEQTFEESKVGHDWRDGKPTPRFYPN
jgi:hypothetical protein